MSVCSTHKSQATPPSDLKFGGCHPDGTSVCNANFHVVGAKKKSQIYQWKKLFHCLCRYRALEPTSLRKALWDHGLVAAAIFRVSKSKTNFRQSRVLFLLSVVFIWNMLKSSSKGKGLYRDKLQPEARKQYVEKIVCIGNVKQRVLLIYWAKRLNTYDHVMFQLFFFKKFAKISTYLFFSVKMGYSVCINEK